ncbi:hypothetical protein, partial [Chryseobacterium balustinum]|uniref:hypothetical protein n=1 Tax=Chryseobacterium balustinum TaxID=246 RepID=UPI001E3889A3
RFFFVAILKIFCCFTKVNKTAKGKATGGLVQQGFCNSWVKVQSLTVVLRLSHHRKAPNRYKQP